MTSSSVFQSDELPITFCLQWIVVTVVGFIVSLCWVEVGFRPEMRLIQGAIGGLVIGTAQWLVLQRRLPKAGWWIVATAIAWGLIGQSKLGALGWVVPKGLYSVGLRSLYGGFDGLQTGALLGALQYFVLRKHIPNATSWIAGNSIGWAIGLAMAWSIGAILRIKTGLFLGEVIGLGLGWIAIATITGVWLSWLLQRSSRNC